MIWHIAKRECLSNILTARFAIGFLLCLVLIPFAIIINLDDYGNQTRIYEIDKAKAEKAFKEVRVYSYLQPQVVQPPEPLSIFCKGISPNVGNTVQILLGKKPLFAEGNMKVRDNPMLNSFFSLDFVSIVAIIMSLLAILFTHDACTREKEDGTLKMQMVNDISRSKILMGKVCGVYLTLLPIILFCYILSFLLILFSPHVSFSPGDWTRIGVLFVTSVVFFSVFILIGLLISTRSKSSITSIIVCLFFWVFFIFLAPNLSVYLAESMVSIPSRDTLDFSIRDLENEYENKREAYSYRELEYPVWWNRASNSGDDGALIVSNCAKSFFEWTRKGFEYSVPLRIEYADKKWALQKAYLDNLDRQRSVAEKISLISPAEIFRLTASIICRTSVDSHHRFMERTRWYREEFIDHLESKNFPSSYIWFTPIPEEKFLTANEFFTYVSEGEIDNIEEWDRRIDAQNGLATGMWKRSVPDYYHNDYPFLNVSDVPRFQFQSERLTDTLLPIFSRTGGLIFTSIVLFYLAFLSFMKYDVR